MTSNPCCLVAQAWHYTVSESFLLNHLLANTERWQSWVAMPPLLLHHTRGHSVRLQSTQPLNRRADVLARLAMASATIADQDSAEQKHSVNWQRFGWMRWRWPNESNPSYRNSWQAGARCASQDLDSASFQGLRASLEAKSCAPPTVKLQALASQPSCAAEWGASQLAARTRAHGASIVILFRGTPFLQLRKWIECVHNTLSPHSVL